jgi:4a-hydroxytetrahydrobiopterin dehydratase
VSRGRAIALARPRNVRYGRSQEVSMADLRKLEHHEIEAELAGLPGWELENGKLHRELGFGDFVEAFGFMASVALVA